MPIFGQTATETVRLPAAWWVPAAQTEVIDRLRLHGIRLDPIDAPRRLTVDRVRLVDPAVSRPSEGRYPVTARFVHEAAEELMPAGSVRVSADQPLGLLAAALLEPESQDSFLAWGFLPEMLSPVLAALGDRMLATDPRLRAEFDAALATDRAFAADPDARRAWLYARAGPGHPFALRYPIAREPARRATRRAREVDGAGAGGEKERPRRRKALNRNGKNIPENDAPPSCRRSISQLHRLPQVSPFPDYLLLNCMNSVRL